MTTHASANPNPSVCPVNHPDEKEDAATPQGERPVEIPARDEELLRLKGERAEKKLAHWQGVAIAACEQCGRNRLPLLHEVASFGDWLRALPAATAETPRLLLSLREGTQLLAQSMASWAHTTPMTLLSGPEGGLSAAEEDAAMAQGFVPVNLGPRVLRAETAPLACLALLTLSQP